MKAEGDQRAPPRTRMITSELRGVHSTYWSAVAWSAVVGKPLLRDPSVALLETTPLSHVILLSRRSFHSHRSLHYVDSNIFHHVRLASAEAADDTRTRPLGRSTTRSNCATTTTTTTRCLRVCEFHDSTSHNCRTTTPQPYRALRCRLHCTALPVSRLS